jgi:hypothetical protein
MADSEGMRIYNEYKSNPKVTIYKLIKGKKGFDTAVEMLFSNDVSGGKEWSKNWSADEKRKAIFFIYKRKLVSKYKIGIKLIIGKGENASVIGEEYYADKIPSGWPANI